MYFDWFFLVTNWRTDALLTSLTFWLVLYFIKRVDSILLCVCQVTFGWSRTSKRDKNWPVIVCTSFVLATFWRQLWSITEQRNGVVATWSLFDELRSNLEKEARNFCCFVQRPITNKLLNFWAKLSFYFTAFIMCFVIGNLATTTYADRTTPIQIWINNLVVKFVIAVQYANGSKTILRLKMQRYRSIPNGKTKICSRRSCFSDSAEVRYITLLFWRGKHVHSYCFPHLIFCLVTCLLPSSLWIA